MSQGAEARIYETMLLGRRAIVKERFAKTCVVFSGPPRRLVCRGVGGGLVCDLAVTWVWWSWSLVLYL